MESSPGPAPPTEAGVDSRVCPHCRAAGAHPLGSHRWEFQGETFTLCTCPACRGIFTTPAPSEGLMAWLYESAFDYRWYRHHYPAKFVDCVHRLLSYRRRGFLEGRRMLDYGGGVGYMERAARLLGWECTTWDPQAGVTAVRSVSAVWDTVLCHHTLEHAVDPAAMLGDIRRRTREGSRLVLAVPNAAGRGYRELGVDWVWFQPPLLHLHHFTPPGLHALLERTGFTVLETAFHDRWDASTLADLHARNIFRKLDGAWSRLPLPWLMAQITSSARHLALLLNAIGERGAPDQRAEILVVARAAAGGEPA